MTDRIPLTHDLVSGRAIAIARRVPLTRLRGVAEVLAEEQIGVIEVTLDGSDALTAIEALTGDGWYVGAGTVRQPEQVAAAIGAGARFIVSPHTDPAVIGASLEHEVPVLPGAFTPTEVVTAWRMGASAVKLFPASTGGPAYLRAVLAPLSDIAIVPTGGIDDSNASAYLDAGAVAIGVGGWLTGPTDPDVVRARARSLREAIRSG